MKNQPYKCSVDWKSTCYTEALSSSDTWTCPAVFICKLSVYGVRVLGHKDAANTACSITGEPAEGGGRLNMRPQSAGPVVSSVVSYWGTNLGSQSKQNVFICLSRNWIWSWPRLSDWQKISSRELSEEMRQLWESEALTMASGGGGGKSNWVSATCQVPNLVRCFQGLI